MLPGLTDEVCSEAAETTENHGPENSEKQNVLEEIPKKSVACFISFSLNINRQAKKLFALSKYSCNYTSLDSFKVTKNQWWQTAKKSYCFSYTCFDAYFSKSSMQFFSWIISKIARIEGITNAYGKPRSQGTFQTCSTKVDAPSAV